MDEAAARQAQLDAKVAEAVEAWLGDPLDVAGYRYLIAAVRTRRAHLDSSTSGGERGAVVVELVPVRVHVRIGGEDAAGDEADGDEADGDEADSLASVKPVGALLEGDAKEVLGRLLGRRFT